MKNRSRESGQTLIIFLLICPVLVGAMGLTVDLGWSYFRKQSAVAAAQAAALAAVSVAGQSTTLSCSSANVVCQSPTPCPMSPPASAATDFDVACAYASDNGFAPSGNKTITVAAGSGTPPTVAGVTAPYWVTVRISEIEPQSFSSVLGHDAGTVSARATAAYFPGSGGCVYLLNANIFITSLILNSNSLLQIGCGVLINAQTLNAISLGPNSHIQENAGATVSVVSGLLNIVAGALSSVQLGAPAAADPFASMPAPAVGSCTSTAVSVVSGSRILSPGVYCGAVSISGSGSVTLNPGTYILKNGISVSGAGSLSGNGVTLYVPSGSVNSNTTGSVTLSPPTSGTYQGITIFQDRGNSTADTIIAATENVQGVIYDPAALLTMAGITGGVASRTTIVAGSLTVVGTLNIQFPVSTPYTPNITGANLIE